jgi:hypothetical protein
LGQVFAPRRQVVDPGFDLLENRQAVGLALASKNLRLTRAQLEGVSVGGRELVDFGCGVDGDFTGLNGGGKFWRTLGEYSPRPLYWGGADV